MTQDQDDYDEGDLDDVILNILLALIYFIHINNKYKNISPPGIHKTMFGPCGVIKSNERFRLFCCPRVIV